MRFSGKLTRRRIVATAGLAAVLVALAPLSAQAAIYRNTAYIDVRDGKMHCWSKSLTLPKGQYLWRDYETLGNMWARYAYLNAGTYKVTDCALWNRTKNAVARSGSVTVTYAGTTTTVLSGSGYNYFTSGATMGSEFVL